MSVELLPAAGLFVLALFVGFRPGVPGRWLDRFLGAFGIGGLGARAAAVLFFVTSAATYAGCAWLLASRSDLPRAIRLADAAGAAIVVALLVLWFASRSSGRGTGLGD